MQNNTLIVMSADQQPQMNTSKVALIWKNITLHFHNNGHNIQQLPKQFQFLEL